MEVKVSQIEGVKFSVQARSHVVVCDQPVENHGTDTGMTPPEMFLGALASCAAFYAAEYLRTRELSGTGVEVSVSAEKLLHPARLANFHISVQSPVPLTDQQTEAMLRVVHSCLIHNTLLAPPKIRIEVEAPVLQG